MKDVPFKVFVFFLSFSQILAGGIFSLSLPSHPVRQFKSCLGQYSTTTTYMVAVSYFQGRSILIWTYMEPVHGQVILPFDLHSALKMTFTLNIFYGP